MGTDHAGSTAYPAHYLVLEMDRDGGIEPVFHRFVELATPPQSKSDTELLAVQALDNPRKSQVVLQLLSQDGRVVFQDLLQIPQSVRGEFHGKARSGSGWEIEAHRFPLPLTSFAVRVPRMAGTSLVMEGLQRTVLDLDRVAETADLLPLSRIHLPDQPRAILFPYGNPANRVDLLIMGDGYTAAQESSFDSDAATLESEFFVITPYSNYRSHVNVTTLFTASPESGADHPPYDPECQGAWTCCSDPAAASDPLAGTYVDTAFYARYCAWDIHRLLVVNFTMVLMAASAVPDWDMIIVLVNDPTYGGSGGGMSVVSNHPGTVYVAQHEHGHSFTGLADEYEAPYPDYPACSDISDPLCEPNVTDETVPGLIKWSPWIEVSTPIPTPEGDPAYSDAVGLFEGARYLEAGMYRPRDRCLMRVYPASFGEICVQEYILRLYEGGWGAPALGIDPIEPSSESPPPGGVSATTCGLSISVDLLPPMSGTPLGVTWSVDGVPVAGENSDSYLFMPPGVGTYQVEIEVEDLTPLVHPTMAGTALQSSRQWTVDVSPGSQVTADAGADFVAPESPVPITLDGSSSTGSQCTGALEFRWRIGGTVLQDFSANPVLEDTLSGATVYTLDVRCSNAPDCADSDSVTVVPAETWEVSGTPGTLSTAAFLGGSSILTTWVDPPTGISTTQALGVDIEHNGNALRTAPGGTLVEQLSNSLCHLGTTTPVGGDEVEFTDSTLVVGSGEVVGYLAVPVNPAGLTGTLGKGRLPGSASGAFSRGVVDPAALSSCAP
jgi:hypothetical protein